MTLGHCRVCGSQDVERVLDFGDFPCHIWPLPDDADRQFRDLDVFACDACGHLQLQDLEDAFIRELYVNEAFNVEDPEANRKRMQMVESRMGGDCFHGKRTLDIGGGRNAFSGVLPEGEKWICDFGVSDDVRRLPGVRAVEDDFTKADLPTDYFDFVSMFHALEHFNDPQAAVGRMADLLAPGGRILVEVPNIRRVIDVMPYYAVFHQHISMFAAESLVGLFAKNGLSIEHWLCKDDVLFAVFTECATSSPVCAARGREIAALLRERLDGLSKALSDLALNDDPERVGLYGAGGSSALFLAHFPWLKDRVGVCFDRDARKQGRCLPGTDIRIEGPEVLGERPIEQLIFLTTGLREAVGDRLSIQTVDIEGLIRTIGAPELAS